MAHHQKALEKSRLGEILINRGLITPEHLAQALVVQHQTGKRLGEVMIAQGWITESQLRRALTRQRSYRYALALTAAMTAPFAPLVSFASQAEDDESQAVMSATLHDNARPMGRMQPLNEGEMSAVSGQGLADGVTNLVPSLTQGLAESVAAVQEGKQPTFDGLTLVRNVIEALSPFEADLKMSDVVYDESQPPVKVDASGFMELRLPKSIGSVVLTNVRVKGTDGPSFGDMALINMRFNDNNFVRVSIRS